MLASDWSTPSSKDIWSGTYISFKYNDIAISSKFAESSLSILVLKSPTL